MKAAEQKPHVYKIIPEGAWWVSAKDEKGKLRLNRFNTHTEALSIAARFAAGIYQ